MKKLLYFLLLSLVLIQGLAASGKKEVTKTNNDKLVVAVTFDAIKELSAVVGADRIEIVPLVPQNAEAHDFEPRPQDLLSIKNADVIVYNGQGMEPWLEDGIKAAGKKNLVKIEASKNIKLIDRGHDDDDHHDAHGHDDDHDHDAHGHDDDDDHDHDAHGHDDDHDHDAHGHDDDHDHDAHGHDDDHDHDAHGHDDDHDHDAHEHHHHSHGSIDPHTWLGFSTAQIMAQNIATGFAKADPANKAFYKKNADDFSAKLETLLKEYKAKIAKTTRKEIVVGHAAFGYLCRDFGLTQQAVRGLFNEGEPSPRAIAELADFAEDHGLTTVFSEQNASAAVSEVLAREVGAKVEVLYTMETSADGLSFLERLQKNIERIYESLK